MKLFIQTPISLSVFMTFVLAIASSDESNSLEYPEQEDRSKNLKTRYESGVAFVFHRTVGRTHCSPADCNSVRYTRSDVSKSLYNVHPDFKKALNVPEVQKILQDVISSIPESQNCSEICRCYTGSADGGCKNDEWTTKMKFNKFGHFEKRKVKLTTSQCTCKYPYDPTKNAVDAFVNGEKYCKDKVEPKIWVPYYISRSYRTVGDYYRNRAKCNSNTFTSSYVKRRALAMVPFFYKGALDVCDVEERVEAVLASIPKEQSCSQYCGCLTGVADGCCMRYPIRRKLAYYKCTCKFRYNPVKVAVDAFANGTNFCKPN